MEMTWARFLLDSQVLRLGDFQLKSGRRSPYFLNFGQVFRGRHLDELGRHYADFLQAHLAGRYDSLLGPAYKGIPLAVAACAALWKAHEIDCGYTSFRKESKAHGEGGLTLGMPAAGRRLVLLDDVLTSGSTKYEILETLKREAPDAELVAMVVGVDRQELDDTGRPAAAAFTERTGIPVLALATADSLMADLERLGGLSEADQAAIKRYRDGAATSPPTR